MTSIRLTWVFLIGLFVFYPGRPDVFYSAYADEPTLEKIPFSISTPKNLPGKKQEESPWTRLETRYTIIQFEKIEDLKKFDRKVDFLPSDFSLKSFLSETASQELEGKIRKKIDALYERVQEILDMLKKSEKKIAIQLYPDKKRLAQAYKKIFGAELNVRAWYLYEINTIFINIDDIDEGMLAHEMAHAIIDNYLTTRAPRAAAEILAVYVDTHLFKKTKNYGPSK
ncbi:MAG: hypothetical protein COS92_08000 [Desulfobacterales bacterium CG07_land_8_20_14_0_80_52_14]|nr:MAG: hypothetical protein COS92_08000 [Desulfobacterales bacterium CG07_land_8_20_14_0_80_52_14]